MLFGLTNRRAPRLQLLKNVVLFKDLCMRDLAMVDSLMHERSYIADEVIFDEGEEGQGLFLVLSGRVKITLPADVDTVLIELGPGAFFGEVALLDQSVRTAQARAIEDTQIVVLFRAERSEEHTSELQSPDHLVCRLLLEKKKNSHIYDVAVSLTLTASS